MAKLMKVARRVGPTALGRRRFHAGRPKIAAQLLRDLSRHIAPGTWRQDSPDEHLARAHFALAEGRAADAIREFRLGEFGHCVTCVLPMLSIAYQRAGMPDSARGDTVAAERHLAAFVEIWRGADPELRPQVDMARRELDGMQQRGAVNGANVRRASFAYVG